MCSHGGYVNNFIWKPVWRDAESVNKDFARWFHGMETAR